MAKVLAATPQTIAAIRKMSHIPIVMNSRGPQHIPSGGGGGAAGYSGYFSVTDISTTEGETTTLKVSVDGGYAIFNGTVFLVASEEITVTASGFLFLKSTMGVDDPPLPLAPVFEYLASYPAVESDVGRRLIATVEVNGTSMTIHQQQHGEVVVEITGTCESTA